MELILKDFPFFSPKSFLLFTMTSDFYRPAAKNTSHVLVELSWDSIGTKNSVWPYSVKSAFPPIEWVCKFLWCFLQEVTTLSVHRHSVSWALGHCKEVKLHELFGSRLIPLSSAPRISAPAPGHCKPSENQLISFLLHCVGELSSRCSRQKKEHLLSSKEQCCFH